MTTLAKGLAVLGAFGRQRPSMTLSEAAQVADLSRATARRVLRTLVQLGYVEQDGRRLLRFEGRQSRGHGATLRRLVAPAPQGLAESPADGRVVVYDENLLLTLFQKFLRRSHS